MSLSAFKENLASLTEIIYFDTDNYLREKTSNPVELKKVINEAEELLNVLDKELLNNKDAMYFLYGTIGNLYRIYGKPKTAIYYLEISLNQAIENQNLTREIVSLIRLGEALKYDNNHRNALDNFNEALVKSGETGQGSYLDFALQHKGKCLLELNRVEEALKCFKQALQIRRLKDIDSLIKSTQQAIEFAENNK